MLTAVNSRWWEFGRLSYSLYLSPPLRSHHCITHATVYPLGSGTYTHPMTHNPMPKHKPTEVRLIASSDIYKSVNYSITWNQAKLEATSHPSTVKINKLWHSQAYSAILQRKKQQLLLATIWMALTDVTWRE